MSQILTSELIRRLAYGELSNLKMASAGDGTILAADRPKVLFQINNALTELFTTYSLSKKELIVNTTPEITNYYLRSEFAVSNLASTQPVKYLDDSGVQNWDGRIVKVLSVFNAFGQELFLNKVQEPLSLFTPEYDCLQITANHETTQFWVIFQALHPIVNYAPAPADPVVDTPIEGLPPSLEKPLELLVASKIFGNIAGQANMTKSAMLQQQYDNLLTKTEFRDSASTSENMSNGKLDQNGFV